MTAVSSDTSLDDSDYGDFGDDVEALEILEQLIARADIDIEDDPGLRLPKVLGVTTYPKASLLNHRPKRLVEKKQKSTLSPESLSSPPPPPPPPAEPPPVPDDRSPLERFRKPPKKAFSVTDLVSPAWCELQYYYSLVEPRRKKKTAAMKRGTAVHQALEDEIHTTVPVEATKREDKWGLKFWNIIQGLRTLRATGRTRELEIWGTVGDEVVNGIIDELSYECPVPSSGVQRAGEDEKNFAERQTTLTGYLGLGQQTEGTSGNEHMIYITDVKTRGSSTLPTGSSIRPTILQLHLYHHLLQNLIIGKFQLAQLADRYALDANETFSDSFIAQVSMLNEDLSQAAPPSSLPGGDYGTQHEFASTQEDSLDILLTHNNLSSLWDYMMYELRTTFVIPDTKMSTDNDDDDQTSLARSLAEDHHGPTENQFNSRSQSVVSYDTQMKLRLSNILTAEYLTPNYRKLPGTLQKPLGRKSFGFNATYLRTYLEDNMAWWHGKRAARGVELQDAWKCRSCDFRDDCRWIHDRDEQSLKDALEKKRLRQAAGLEKVAGIQRSEV